MFCVSLIQSIGRSVSNQSAWKWRLWSTIRLSRTIRSVATGTQWSWPMKSHTVYCELLPGRMTESDSGPRPRDRLRHRITFYSLSLRCHISRFSLSLSLSLSLILIHVLAGLPSRGGDVTVYVWHKPTELAHSFLFSSCVYFCLYGYFSSISFHKFSRQLSVFSHCSSGLISALLVLSIVCLFMKVSFSPDIVPSGWLVSTHQLTN